MFVFAALLPLENLIKLTIEYAQQRVIFDKPLLDNQVVHFRLAEMQTEVECLRALTYRAVGEWLVIKQIRIRI